MGMNYCFFFLKWSPKEQKQLLSESHNLNYFSFYVSIILNFHLYISLEIINQIEMHFKRAYNFFSL